MHLFYVLDLGGCLTTPPPMIPQESYTPNEATIGHENNKQMGG